MNTKLKEEFEKFWFELSDTRKWKDGKPVVDGYVYVTVGNAVWNWIEDHFLSSKSLPNDYLKEYGRTVHKGGGR